MNLYGICVASFFVESFTPPDPADPALISPVLTFLKFAMIQDIVWMDFSVSDLKFNYMGKDIIKFFKIQINLIGE